jgi:hypothetical protein
MNRIASAALALLPLVLIGCPSGNEGTPDAGAQVQECTSRVDGKLGGEDCRCNGDPDCAAGYACENHFCMVVACEVDDDCLDGEICLAHLGTCSQPTCGETADCAAGKICIGGTCTTAPDPATVGRCAINGTTVSRQGQTLNLSATAYSAGGAVVSAMTYTWAITAGADAASVAGGVITGADATADWEVTATVAGTSVTCVATGNNYADVDAGWMRVIVVDQRDGALVEGAAVVMVKGELVASTTTDASGVALLDLTGQADSVTVFYDTPTLGANYVTVVRPSTMDLLIPVFTKEKARVAGVKGAFDYSKLANRQLKLGLAGLSMPENFADIDFSMLIGESVPTVIDIPGLPIPEDGVALPQGLTMAFGTSDFKPTYAVQGIKGQRTLWGLGGSYRLSAITDLLPVLAPVLENADDGIPVGLILASVMPLLSQMHHAAAVGIQVASVACVANETSDCPQALGEEFQTQDLSFASGLDFRTSFTMPLLPRNEADDGFLGGTFGIVGVNLPGQGLVPLGIGAGVDDLDTRDEEAGDGHISAADGSADDQMLISYARQHSGLDGHGIYNLVLALDIDALGGSLGGDTGDAPAVSASVSGLVVSANHFAQCDGNVATCIRQPTFSSFLPLPAGAHFDSVSRSFTAGSAVADADFYRIAGEGSAGNWIVLFDKDQYTGQFALPEVPEGYEDRIADMTVQAFALAGDRSLEELVTFGGHNLDGLNAITEKFSSVDCVANGNGCGLTECAENGDCADGETCQAGLCAPGE